MIFKLGTIPIPGSIAPSGQVEGGSRGEGEGVESLRNERNPKKCCDFKEIVRAYNKLKQTTIGNLVLLLFTWLRPHLRKKVVMVQVARNSYYKQDDAGALQINCRLWKP